ncbi:sulfate/molybdate ABC transporter ATP-binding protein [Enterococcus sp. CSURQ0835]|uniref:sulfate/molybdate ABC transporter ATP-binding protein n=1 Tax=Enterococcus sp. CSURQ0835 TaxID=2681394 RepID=UPI00135694CD|nr:ATP-binding cassette domain-containing protein [Enterococcus sp. CSURQ0835]
MSLEVDFTKKLTNFTLRCRLTSQNDQLALLGASGSGKSMILKCIAGIEQPDAGRIIVNGRTLYDSEKKIDLRPQRRKVGYLFQNYALFPNLTVRQNIACVAQKTAVDALLARFELTDVAQQYSHALSGGQQQRVALARLLASQPDILLLDEPFSALDTFLKEKVELEMKHFLATYDGDVIFVTHNRNEAYRLCQKLAILDQGQVVESGEMKQIFDQPQQVATARLTGVKNISRIEKLDDYTVRALDWQLVLKTARKVTADVTQIGVRAHDLAPCSPSAENAFAATILEQSETPFEQQFYCQGSPGTRELWWKLAKSQPNQFTGHLTIPPSKIQLLKDTCN